MKFALYTFHIQLFITIKLSVGLVYKYAHNLIRGKAIKSLAGLKLQSSSYSF